MWIRLGAAACWLSCVGCSSGPQCGSGCGSGCSYAGMKYDCSCEDASSACHCGSGCTDAAGGCGRTLLGKLCGCTGCGELYWNEWQNDPPACYEPCDCLGRYTGPAAAGHLPASYAVQPYYAGGEPGKAPRLAERAAAASAVR